MIIFVVALVAILGIIFGAKALHEQNVIKTNKRKTAEFEATYSWPARTVIKAYEKLPVEHRPDINVRAAVKALDIKYGGIEVASKHFYNSHGYSYELRYGWDCKCITHSTYCYGENYINGCCGVRKDGKCLIPEYKEMIDSFNLIWKAIERRDSAERARQHNLIMAGLEYDLQSVAAITSRVRAEADLIDEVTKEISA